MRRKLFWKVYATLLASLILAALAFSLFGFMSDSDEERHSPAFQVRFLQATIPIHDAPPGEIDRAVARLASGLGGTVEVFTSSGRRIAASGVSTAAAVEVRERDVTLVDGRVVRIRLADLDDDDDGLLFLATIVAVIGLAAWPVVAQLTRRLERVRVGVALWGTGVLSTRVPAHGGDEVSAVARAFNDAANQVERLLGTHRSLLAHASHELRSPLARLRMAVELNREALPADASSEIVRNLVELDDLVEEILLSSRLEHGSSGYRREPVDLLALAAEEASRFGAEVAGTSVVIDGDPRLLRRLFRNLLENARKHGASPIKVEIDGSSPEIASLTVRDGGRGINPDESDRVFEPFYRPADRSEVSGSWGLGLTLVRQIATHHGGTAIYDVHAACGSAFVVTLQTRGNSMRRNE